MGGRRPPLGSGRVEGSSGAVESFRVVEWQRNSRKDRGSTEIFVRMKFDMRLRMVIVSAQEIDFWRRCMQARSTDPGEEYGQRDSEFAAQGGTYEVFDSVSMEVYDKGGRVEMCGLQSGSAVHELTIHVAVR